MRYRELLFEEAIQEISPQEAKDKNMFGPLYHGTAQGNIENILQSGFDVSRSSNLAANGYRIDSYSYATGIAPPMHHLGFGAYLTTVKAIAKQFAGGTMKGQRTFYLNSQNILEINFGSERTMMKWWIQNGYDMTTEATKKHDVIKWREATQHLTDNLSSKYDAVWFKGKSIGRLLDGDQVCVYRPNLVMVVNPKLAGEMEIGSKVTHTQIFANDYRLRNVFYVEDLAPGMYGKAGQLIGWKGVFRADESDDERKNRETRGIGKYPLHMIPPPNVVGIIVEKQGNGR